MTTLKLRWRIHLLFCSFSAITISSGCHKYQYKGGIISEKKQEKLAEDQDYLLNQAKDIVTENTQERKKEVKKAKRKRRLEIEEMKETGKVKKLKKKEPLRLNIY